MTSLVETAIFRSRTIFMVLAMVFVAGIYSYIAIPKESSPDIPLPFIYVSISHEGISPEDAVNLLIKPLEQELRDLENLDTMESTAFEGGGNIMLTFVAGADNEKALNDTRTKVDLAKSKLPEESDEPVVKETNISTDTPVLTVILQGNVPERTLRQTAEDLQDALENIPGVLEAELKGTREEQVVVEINRPLLEAYDIPAEILLSGFTSNNQMVAAGSLEVNKGKYPVKVPGLFSTEADIMNLPLYAEGDRQIRTRDIATVRRGFKDTTSVARINGEPAVTLEVRKRIGENIIHTVEQVKEVVAEVGKSWPAGIRHRFIGDESKRVRTMLNDLQNSVLLAVLLVMVVVLMAMGLRPALLVAVAIPGSFLMALTVLFASGMTTNIVVLFGLIFSVGMLVDGAIVVTELADKRLQAGQRRREAFSYAARYMVWPITASTITTLAAFFPLLFWPDIVGEFMKFLPLTLIYTLSASLLMALLFLPVLGCHLGGVALQPGELTRRLENGYCQFLERALAKPGKILFFGLSGFVAAIVLYATLGQGVEFFPNVEPESGRLKIHSRGDYSLVESDDVMRQISQKLNGLAGVRNIYVTTGKPSRRGSEPDDIIGSVFLDLEEWEDRDRAAHEIFNEARQRLADIPGIWVETSLQRRGPRQGKPIRLLVTSENYNLLPSVASTLTQRLEELAGTENVTNSLPNPGIEWNLKINRREASRAGTNVLEVGRIIRMVTTGTKIGTYRPIDSNDEMDIMARLSTENRTLSTLEEMTMATPAGQVPLANFLARSAQPKITSISRFDQKYVVFVEADVEEGFLADSLIRQVRAGLENTQLPPGVAIEFKGEDEQQKKSQSFLMKAFVVAVFVMGLILVTQFNSFYQAGIILSAVVLSTTGVFVGHVLMGNPFGIVMSGLGVIALAGVVVNNNIVLIDTFNKLHRKMDWYSALVETGRARLRPVLLTAITTIVGLLPMALRLNVDFIARRVQYNSPSTQWWDQLASSIAFGLAFATTLTLVMTPCMIALVCRWQDKKTGA